MQVAIVFIYPVISTDLTLDCIKNMFIYFYFQLNWLRVHQFSLSPCLYMLLHNAYTILYAPHFKAHIKIIKQIAPTT